MTVVFALMTFCDEKLMTTGAVPQLKVTVPPPLSAALSAGSVQLAPVPVPKLRTFPSEVP